MSALHYDPYSEEALKDSHPIYRRLRAEKPAYYLEKYDAWALSRFEDVWNASLDAESYSVAVAGASSGHLLTRQPVMFLYASANRDEREFEDPDTFDVRRRLPRVLTFGHGTHACLGQNVARLEGRILLEELLAAMPDYAVETVGCVQAHSEWMQGYLAVPVRFPPFSLEED